MNDPHARRPRDVGRRILVRLPNWLGDAMMARPLLHAVRRAVRGGEVRAIGPKALVDLLAADSGFDVLHAVPPDAAGRSALARVLRAWRPDLALLLPPSFSSAWFAFRTGAVRRIGYAADWRSALLTTALTPAPRGDVHVTDGYLALGAAAGVEAVEPPPLAVPDGGDAEASALLEAESVTGPFVVLAPGAMYGPAKRWFPERFAELGRALAAGGAVVLVCGGAGELRLASSVADAIGDGARVLAGRTSLGAQAALCVRARVVVSNDSGLAHLAAAAGGATVAVFGSTSSAWTAPRGPRVRVVQRAPVCAPCFRRTCRIGYRCLDAVTVHAVLAACRDLAA